MVIKDKIGLVKRNTIEIIGENKIKDYMKKFTLLLGLILVITMVSFVSAVECEDSDGGQNYEVKGVSTGVYAGSTAHIIIEEKDQTYTPSPYNYSIIHDYCFDKYQVHESWCSNGQIHMERVSCDIKIENTICSDGACIPNPLATNKQCSEFGFNKQYGVINYCDDNKNSYDLSVCYNVSYACSDSDGEDYYTLGQISVSSSSKQGQSCNTGVGSFGGGGGGSPVKDTCVDSITLKERICNSDGTAGFVEYTCPVKCSGGVCVEDDTSTTTYFKNCNYIWDSSPYVGQTVKIAASVRDTSGSVDSDSVEVNVFESVLGGTGGAYPMDGKTLDIQIIEPGSGDVAGAVEIKINSKGPFELGEMSLGLFGDRWGAGFPISNRNCVAGGFGGGGSGGGSTCEKYHICEDGSEVQYCEIIKQYDDEGNVVGAGCACKQNPEELCTPPSSGGEGGGQLVEILSSGGGGGNNETPIICNGCILGDKCAPVGYRTEDKYCTIDSELLDQKKANLECNNNFECKSNVCVSDECVSEGLLKRIIDWFRKLFGGE